MTGEEQTRVEEAYLVLSELRHLLHREEDTFEEYQRISVQFRHRIAGSAHGLGKILPPARLAALDNA